MAVESTYSVIKAALVQRLQARGGLSGVNVSAYLPVNSDDIRTPTGAYESIAMGDADGSFDDIVFCAGNLRFDETLLVTIVIEVHGRDSSDTQKVVDRRVNELLFEVLADVADQQNWDKATLGLDVFDYVFFTPSTQRWIPGRLQQTGVFAASVEVGIEVRSRRSFP